MVGSRTVLEAAPCKEKIHGEEGLGTQILQSTPRGSQQVPIHKCQRNFVSGTESVSYHPTALLVSQIH